MVPCLDKSIAGIHFINNNLKNFYVNSSILKTEDTSRLWQWGPIAEQIGGVRATNPLDWFEVKVSLWAFGAASCKPLALKGTWSGLLTVRTASVGFKAH